MGGSSSKFDVPKHHDPDSLNVIMKDLRILHTELLPNAQQEKNAEELKNMDNWQLKKRELNLHLKELSENVKRLNDIRSQHEQEYRDTKTIAIQHENEGNLAKAKDMWDALKASLQKLCKKPGKLTEKDLNDRKKITALLAEEIMNLKASNARVKGKKTDNKPSVLASRREQRLKDRKARREDRRARGGGKGKAEEDFDLPEDQDMQSQPVTQQQQEFYDYADAKKEEQDEYLDDILKGMEELKEIGTEIGKNLELQGHMLEEVETKMDENIENLKTSNQRLKNLVDASGGATKWCPMMICFIILFALVGYIYQQVG